MNVHRVVCSDYEVSPYNCRSLFRGRRNNINVLRYPPAPVAVDTPDLWPTGFPHYLSVGLQITLYGRTVKRLSGRSTDSIINARAVCIYIFVDDRDACGLVRTTSRTLYLSVRFGFLPCSTHPCAWYERRANLQRLLNVNVTATAVVTKALVHPNDHPPKTVGTLSRLLLKRFARFSCFLCISKYSRVSLIRTIYI